MAGWGSSIPHQAAAYLIKQQHTWPGQDCPGNGNSLLLPAGQPDASLAHSGVVALRKAAGNQQQVWRLAAAAWPPVTERKTSGSAPKRQARSAVYHDSLRLPGLRTCVQRRFQLLSSAQRAMVSIH